MYWRKIRISAKINLGKINLVKLCFLILYFCYFLRFFTFNLTHSVCIYEKCHEQSFSMEIISAFFELMNLYFLAMFSAFIQSEKKNLKQVLHNVSQD